MHRLLLTATAALAVAAPAAAVPTSFRVAPYLQQPTSNSMLVTWFTEADASGRITVRGPGLAVPLVINTTPTNQPQTAYTAAELNQGATLGYPLFAGGNWKHSAPVTGLQPGKTYRYTVEQGGQTFEGSFKTAPTAADFKRIRFIAASDSETEPRGNTLQREYPAGPLAPGSAARQTPGTPAAPTYWLTETQGFARNIEIMKKSRPDLYIMPGDLVQGGGYQLGWDEFFRHTAGRYDTPLSKAPILPALGNWENFGALNGGYTINATINAPKNGRERYKTYFDMPSNGTPAHQGNYYRIDYGPITVITLDSSNGEPDQSINPAALDTDTQNNFTRAQYEAFGGTDLSDFNPGSIQWNWARAQLADARARGQIIFVQWHHTAYSVGEHALPMNWPNGLEGLRSSGQGGTPMRVYQPMLEEFGVVAVLSGHSEIWERSYVDLDGDGRGVHHIDVGMAGDGLRGPLTGLDIANQALVDRINPYLAYLPHRDAPEMWVTKTAPDGTTYNELVSGGRHYGHLLADLRRVSGDPSVWAILTLTPVYSFPLFDEWGRATGETQRRVYDDVLRFWIGFDGQVLGFAQVPAPGTAGLLGLGLAVALALRACRRRQG
jgi:hypothetical protein